MNKLSDKDHWSSKLEVKKEQNRTEQNSSSTAGLFELRRRHNIISDRKKTTLACIIMITQNNITLKEKGKFIHFL